MSLVRFGLGDQLFALSVHSVQEVQRMVMLHPVPAVPPSILGVIDVHGRIVPVLDLRARLGMETQPPTPSSPLLIVNSKGYVLAVLVDWVDGVGWQVETPLVGAGWDCVHGLIELDGQITVLLNADALPTPEIEALLATSAPLSTTSLSVHAPPHSSQRH